MRCPSVFRWEGGPNTQCANASLTFPFNNSKGIGDNTQHAMWQCGVPLPLDGREVPTRNVPENSNAVARRNMFVMFVALAKVPQQSIWTHVFRRLGVCGFHGWLPSLAPGGVPLTKGVLKLPWSNAWVRWPRRDLHECRLCCFLAHLAPAKPMPCDSSQQKQCSRRLFCGCGTQNFGRASSKRCYRKSVSFQKTSSSGIRRFRASRPTA